MKQRVFGHLKITDLSFEEWMEMVDSHIKERKQLSVTRLTLKNFVRSIFNAKLRQALKDMDVVIPAGKFLYGLVKKTYPDYRFALENTKDLLTPLIRKYYSFLVNFVFMGGSLHGLSRLSMNLKASFPELKIIGTYPKSYWENKNEDIKTILQKSEPHVFFLGIGEGKDEVWLAENRTLIPKSVVICVNRQIEVMCHDIPEIPYRYKIASREYSYILRKKPYRILDVFVWAFVWIRWRWFLYKIRKRQKRREVL